MKKLLFEFIQWKDDFTKYITEHRKYKVEIETHISKIFTLNELFNYWLTEIKYK